MKIEYRYSNFFIEGDKFIPTVVVTLSFSQMISKFRLMQIRYTSKIQTRSTFYKKPHQMTTEGIHRMAMEKKVRYRHHSFLHP